MPDIAFTVSENSVTANPSKLSVSAGEEVNFTANETVEVTFHTGQWPFDEPEGKITVHPITGAGPYTTQSTTSVDQGSYTAAAAQTMTSGEIDVHP